MTTNRRRIGATRRVSGTTKIDINQEFFFEMGEDRFIGDATSLFGSADRAHRSWKLHCRNITEEFAHRKIGQRPYAWWRWTAPAEVVAAKRAAIGTPEQMAMSLDNQLSCHGPHEDSAILARFDLLYDWEIDELKERQRKCDEHKERFGS